MKKSLAAACLLLLVHSLPCRAADTSSLPPPIMAVSTILELSDEQVQSLIAMIGARDTAIGPLVAELQRHQGAIEQLLQAPDADAATVGRLVLETRTLNANIATIRGQAVAQFEQVLTPDQLARLKQIRAVAPLSEVVPVFRAVGLV